MSMWSITTPPGSFDVSESRESVMDTGDFNAYEGLEPEYETAMTPFSDG